MEHSFSQINEIINFEKKYIKKKLRFSKIDSDFRKYVGKKVAQIDLSNKIELTNLINAND